MLFHARRIAHGFALVAGISFGALSLSLFALGGTAVAGAATTTSAFYLDIGGSASVGVQPTLVNPRGAPTASGYANDLVALEAAKGSRCSSFRLGVRASPPRPCSTGVTTVTSHQRRN